ncbi:MAG TPA: 4Fe-4S dicluster domain-containing protein [Gemmataceae bacterium]|nr:4Fe-4S dicluster domain-containing protein [Gemmataceae bacterium]
MTNEHTTPPPHHSTTPPHRSAFARQEFPGFANVYESRGEAEFDDANDPGAVLNRRKFLALSAAALGLAGLAGCRRPEIQILPYSAVPDDQLGHVVHGKPTFYATCLPRPGGALPLLVESHDGRPTKVEGNPAHPCSLGSTNAHAQASILDLYSPDRVLSEKYPGVMERGVHRRWEDFDQFARRESAALLKSEGKGLYVLAEDIHSPAVRLVREHMAKKLKNASWHAYEPVDTTEARKGAEIAFGKKLLVRYRFEKAARILALDCDFLGNDPDAVAAGRAFAAGRNADGPDEMNRLYVVESTYSVTGTMADHRLRLPSSQLGALLLAVAREIQSADFGFLVRLPEASLANAAPPAGAEKWVKAVAADLMSRRGRSLIAVGYRQPAWVHAVVHTLNAMLGATDAGLVEFREPPAEPQETRGIDALAIDLASGKVRTLLVIGGNPVFNAPADLDLKTKLKTARFVSGEEPEAPTNKLRLGLFFDHTSEACDWHLPLAHSLEGWGDAEAADGTLCCDQPLIAPLNSAPAGGPADLTPPPRGGRTALEVLTLLTQFAFDGDPKANPPTTSYYLAKARAYELVRRSFAARRGIAPTDPTFDPEFNRYKQLGFLPADQDKAIRKPIAAGELKPAPAKVAAAITAIPPAPSKESLEVAFVPDYSVHDGRFAMNPWLQELPDPITKLVWDNAALISPKTAGEFGLSTGDLVKITARGESATSEIPVFVLPGHADYCVTLPFGQFGEMRIGHVPDGGGFNVYPFRTSSAMHTLGGCRLEKTGRTYDLVITQEHGVIPEGRDIVRELTAREYRAKHTHVADNHGPPIGLAPSAVPNEEDLRKGFQGAYGNPQQPQSPATEKQKRFPLDLARPELLDSQFQWGMVIDLNACTGCSACMVACQSENNVPVVGKHEVMRNREMHWIRIDRYFTTPGGASAEDPKIVTQPVACVHCEQAPCEQVCPVNASVHSPEGLNMQVYNRCIGTRYCSNACPYKVRRFNWFDFNKRRLDELRVPTPLAEGGSAFEQTLVPETLKMQKNPDVTVRMRGVMEKCTYCVQRIERGKYGAKIAAAEVADGRRSVESDPAFRPEGREPSKYRKPKDAATARAVGYDLDKQGRVIVPDGLIVPACAQACPTQAIVFGNALDPTSRVSKLKQKEAEYLLLGELNTKPRTSYLPRVRNVNPELV